MKLYSTAQAAERLGISENTVRHHVYKSGRLRPEVVSGVWVFTEDNLAAFEAWRAERQAVAALSPEEKHRRHRDQQAAHMRRKWRSQHPAE